MTYIKNYGKVKKLFPGSHFDYGFYAWVENNGELVIGEERGREGGTLYRGEYKGDNTPSIKNVKKENLELYNGIVEYFKKRANDSKNGEKKTMNKTIKKPTEIMTKKFNPRKLAEEQHEAYKQYILNILDKVKETITRGAYSDIEKMTAFSGAGDGWGNDNHYIDFGFDKEPMDIMEAVNYLAYLDQYAFNDIPVDTEYHHRSSWIDEN